MRKIPDYVRATTPDERFLLRAGVPADYWHTDLKQLKFRQIAIGKTKVTPAQQRSGLKQLCVDPGGQLVVLASLVEEAALRIACFCLAEMQKAKLPFCLTTADQLWRIDKQDKEDAKRMRCIMIHNLMAEATGPRLQSVRDTLYHQRFRARLLVVAGTKDPFGFVTTRLHLRPDLCCYVEDDFT
jgi:hypothetical protein